MVFLGVRFRRAVVGSVTGCEPGGGVANENLPGPGFDDDDEAGGSFTGATLASSHTPHTSLISGLDAVGFALDSELLGFICEAGKGGKNNFTGAQGEATAKSQGGSGGRKALLLH